MSYLSVLFVLSYLCYLCYLSYFQNVQFVYFLKKRQFGHENFLDFRPALAWRSIGPKLNLYLRLSPLTTVLGPIPVASIKFLR